MRDERQEDHAHRLLGVVGAVRQRDEGRRTDLADAEALALRVVRDVTGDAVDQLGADSGDERRDDGREQRGQDDLAHHAAPLDAAHADRGDRSTDEAAEEGVRRAGRHAEQPRREVPQDAAHEAGEHDQK